MAQPIFIIGSPRSGTSALTWAIGQHPNISVQPETNWMPTIAHAAFDAYQIGTARQEFSQLSWVDWPFKDFMAPRPSMLSRVTVTSAVWSNCCRTIAASSTRWIRALGFA